MEKSSIFSEDNKESFGLPRIYFITKRRKVTDKTGDTLTWIESIYAGKYDTNITRIHELCDKLNQSNTDTRVNYRVLELDAATDKEMEVYIETE